MNPGKESALTHVGLLIAAGAGARFGGAYPGAKLDQLIDGISVGVRAYETLASVCDAMVVVVRDVDSGIARHAGARGGLVVLNAEPERGMGYSLALGAKTVLANYPESLFMWASLADLPFLDKNTLESLAPIKLGLDDHGSRSIIQPVFTALAGASAREIAHQGQPGHPVVFGRDHWSALCALDGDVGARTIIAANRAHVVRVETHDSGIWRDVDTPADLN